MPARRKPAPRRRKPAPKPPRAGPPACATRDRCHRCNGHGIILYVDPPGPRVRICARCRGNGHEPTSHWPKQLVWVTP